MFSNPHLIQITSKCSDEKYDLEKLCFNVSQNHNKQLFKGSIYQLMNNDTLFVISLQLRNSIFVYVHLSKKPTKQELGPPATIIWLV